MTADGHPNAGSTITPVTRGDEKHGYAVNSNGDVAELTQAELVRQVECEPGTSAVPLPDDTNERVSTAAAALADAMVPKPVSLEPRLRDDQVTRYVNLQLGQLRLDDQTDIPRLRHLETLRVVFNGELPVSVNEKIRTLLREGVEGEPLISALTAMLTELPKPDQSDEPPRGVNINIRIVCSMGIL